MSTTYQHYPIDKRFKINFDKILFHFEAIGRHYLNPKFKIIPADKEIIYRVLVILIGDYESCLKRKLDPNKGILLAGPLGCGKTSVMQVAKRFMKPLERYQMRTTRQATYDFQKNGYEAIERLSKTGPIFFDDLGMEQYSSYYRNDCNVMAEILLNRYDLMYQSFTETDRRLRVTYATTNLGVDELAEAYGDRVRSRMKEMFNLIIYNDSSQDKRDR